MSLAFSKYNLSIIVRDAGTGRSKLNFDIQALTIETASFTASAIVSEVQALTNGKVVSWTISETYVENATFLGNAGSQVENQAQVMFRLVEADGAKDQWGILRIPAPIDALFLGTSGDKYDILNPDNAALQTLLARYYGGITGLNYTLLASDGQAAQDPSVAGNVKGGRVHRKSNYS
jgi:hypothetical protein